MFAISHIEDKSLKGRFRIGFDGVLSLPYKVNIRAVGLSFESLRQEVESAYRPFFKSGVNPKLELVDKKVLVEVRGLVGKPGKYLISSTTSIDELISLAGGVAQSAAGMRIIIGGQSQGLSARYIKVSRGRQTQYIDLSTYYNLGNVGTLRWFGGDLAFLQSEIEGSNDDGSGSVHMLGEIRKPGDVAFRGGADFIHYLNKVEGPLPSSDLDKIVVIRGHNEDRKSYEFQLDEVADIPILQSDDTVIVYAVRPTPLQTTLQLISNFVTAILGVAAVIFLFK